MVELCYRAVGLFGQTPVERCNDAFDSFNDSASGARQLDQEGPDRLGDDKKAFLFRSAKGRGGQLSAPQMSQVAAYRMIDRRAASALVATKIGCYSFRATGIAEDLRNGGELEVAQQMANHESSRTTGLYDRRNDQISLDEVERILI